MLIHAYSFPYRGRWACRLLSLLLAKEAMVGLYSEMIEGFLLQKGRLFLVWGIL